MRSVLYQLLLMAIFALLPVIVASSQSPAPVLIEAASTPPVNPTTSTAPSQNVVSIEAAIKLLEQMKVKNEQILKRQEGALQQLDELEQASEQLKIFSKRG
jgi:hypothetical protein